MHLFIELTYHHCFVTDTGWGGEMAIGSTYGVMAKRKGGRVLNPSPEYVLREYYAAWSQVDTEAALRYCTRGVIYELLLPRDVVDFGGEARGKHRMRRTLNAMLRDFEVIAIRPQCIVALGNQGRAQVAFRFRHRQSGLELDGVLRHEVVFELGRIACMREYHDVERFRAFMRLTDVSEARRKCSADG